MAPKKFLADGSQVKRVRSPDSRQPGIVRVQLLYPDGRVEWIDMHERDYREQVHFRDADGKRLDMVGSEKGETYKVLPSPTAAR